MTADQAESLNSMVIDLYQAEREQPPRRVVIHKSPLFEPSEREGFEGFLRGRGCYYDLQDADHVGDTPGSELLREVMVLTMMNWNSANMADLLPITLRFSRLVGGVLREVPADREPQPKSKFYM